MGSENIILLFFLVHLFDVYLHKLIRLNCLVQMQPTAGLRRLTSFFCWVQNLIVELYLVFQSLTASVELINPFLFVSVYGNFGLLGLEGPALLVVIHGLYHSLLPRRWCFVAVNRHFTD